MMLLALLALAAAQSTSDKLPPANPLPLADDEPVAVLAPVRAMLAGLARRDAGAILAQVRPDGSATAVIENADGTRTIRRADWATFAAAVKPGPERYEERLLDPAVEIDGDVAMVWSPYVFLIDGKADHCGADHFDMIREAGRWKVANVTWSQRTTGCEAYSGGR